METDITITIRRSRIDIYPYTLGTSPTLEKRLQCYDYNKKEITMEVYLYNYKDRCLSVPKGFSISEVVRCLETDSIYTSKTIDKSDLIDRSRTVDIKMRPGVAARDEHQISSITFLLDKNDPQKFLNIDTGYGKTFCTIKAISLIGKASMIVMGKSSLMQQWKKVIKEYTFCSDDEICLIQGRDSVKKALRPENLNKYKFYICATQTLAIMAEENELDNFVRTCGIGIKAIDEAHELMKANFYIDLRCNVEYNYYLTATPERSDTSEHILYNRITKTIPRYGSYTTELKKYIHVKNVLINTQPAPFHKRICRTKQGFSSIIYENFIFKNDNKKTFLFLICMYIISKLINHDKEAKILILFSTKDHINQIAALIKKNLGITCGIFTSDLNDDLKKAQLNKNVILSTLKSSGAGMDIQGLRAVVNFIPFKSPVLLHQLMGRLRYMEGKALFYFNVVDEGFDDIVRQNFARQIFFKKKSKDISNLELDMNTLLNEYINKKRVA
ncbi:MAG TPA: DEAD/DEAH box helicase family protein [bacterium]|nr:DEAD/DEAH box helicase family protein [bacterium]